ncbi:MAG: hypothetical protein CMI12_01440 [Oceanospirillum sp.]|nr:hypothetical protein [Oceanospirillum sp.]
MTACSVAAAAELTGAIRQGWFMRAVDQVSVMGTWPLVISRALDYYRVDGQALLARVGIDPLAASQLDTRYGWQQIDRLWRLARNVTGDEALGLTVARFMRPTSWQALGFAIWASDNLMECFQRLATNLRMFANYAQMQLVPLGGVVEVEIRLREGINKQDICPEELDALMGTSVLTARHIYRPDFSPIEVWLSRPLPLDPTPWQRLFKCPVYFNASHDRIVMPTQAMSKPLLTASPELATQNDALVADYLARFDRSDLITRLKALLIHNEPIGHLTMAQVAEQLNLSQRTLQRRLQEKELSYKQLVDEVRQQMALQWVRLKYLPMGEISYRLGFANAANFTRAFKRWYDETPKNVRQNWS